jgi:hypothetical protein
MSDSNQGAPGARTGHGNGSQGGQVDHVDSILNEFMQNKDRRNNFDYNAWLDPHSQGDPYAAQGNFHDWQTQQHSDSSFDNSGDYFPQQADQSSYASYGDYDPGSGALQHGGYYGDMSRYHPQHDAMNMRSAQPPARQHIQQVHPRNSSLHTTNLRPQHSGGGAGAGGGGGMYSRGGNSYQPAPTNLLVHQQYRSSPRPYEDRYLQHSTPPLQSGQQYTNMSHYDLSTHVRSQGALNWSTANGQGASGNSRQGMMNAGAPRGGGNGTGGAGARYPPQQTSQMPHYSLPNQGSNPSNYLGNHSTASSTATASTAAGRPLLVQSAPVAPRNMNQPSNPSSISSSSTSSLLNRNSDMAGRDIELEQLIYRNAKAILAETANRCLKSVELANALRDRIGKEALQRTKVLYGGLLVLLELYRETFAVHRIPKNDMVELLAYVPTPYPSNVIQHPQQLLASQIPGYNISAPLMSSNSYSTSPSFFANNGETSSRSHSNSPSLAGNGSGSSDTPTPTLFQTLTKQQNPTKCLFLSKVISALGSSGSHQLMLRKLR